MTGVSRIWKQLTSLAGRWRDSMEEGEVISGDQA
jgi:hypothetical protein